MRRTIHPAALLPWAALVLGIVLRVAFHGAAERTPDEVYYANYAREVLTKGPSFFPGFVRLANDHPTPGLFPWPQRAAYVVIGAIAMAVSGRQTVEALAAVSLLASIAALLVTLLLGRALAGPWTTSAALLLVAASPLDLALSRRAWTDGPLALLVLVMVYACVRFLRGPAWRWAILFVAAGAPALLVKESAWPVYAAGSLCMAWVAARRSEAPRSWQMIAVGALGAVLAVAAVLAACGGPDQLLKLRETARIANAPNEYMIQYQTGSPAYYLLGLWILQPLLLVLGLIGALVAALRPRWLGSDAAARGLGFFTLGFAVMAAAFPQKNLRFLSPLVSPLALLAAIFLAAAVPKLAAYLSLRQRAVAAIVAVLLAGGALLDVLRFHDYFDRRRVIDPTTPMLLRVQRGRFSARPTRSAGPSGLLASAIAPSRTTTSASRPRPL